MRRRRLRGTQPKPPFRNRVEGARTLSLVLRKIGFSGAEIAGMPMQEAFGYIDAFESLNKREPRGKTYKVRRGGKGE